MVQKTCRCPKGPDGPYESFPSKFHRIWSYEAPVNFSKFTGVGPPARWSGRLRAGRVCALVGPARWSGLRAGRACALVGSILFFVGRSRGLPENPWGGKSMGWEIHGWEIHEWEILGKSIDKSRIFGKPDFGEKSRFENKSAKFFRFFKVFGNLYNV